MEVGASSAQCALAATLLEDKYAPSTEEHRLHRMILTSLSSRWDRI